MKSRHFRFFQIRRAGLVFSALLGVFIAMAAGSAQALTVTLTTDTNPVFVPGELRHAIANTAAAATRKNRFFKVNYIRIGTGNVTGSSFPTSPPALPHRSWPSSNPRSARAVKSEPSASPLPPKPI